MNNIDISNWKPFLVKELFDIHPTKAYKLNNMQLLDGGENPVLANSKYNNGIGGYSSLETTEPGNIITFSDTVDADTIFFQDSPFIGYSHVQGLYAIGKYKNQWTKKSLLFFATVFKKIAQIKEFDYNAKFRRDIALEMMVYLPVDSNNEPNWDYMNSFIDKIEKESQSRINILMSIKEEKKKVNINKWKEFAVEDIFPKIIKPVVYHSRDVVEEKNGIPYVVRSKFNNGIKCYVKKPDIVNPPKVISFGAENSNFFYQENEWVSGRDIYYIDVSSLTSNQALFIVFCLQKICSKYKYNYGLFPELLKKEKIKLPIDDNEKIDFDYMEKTIEEIKQSEFKKLMLLNNNF